MKRLHRQATAYLDDGTFRAISKIARDQGRSLSGHLKALIEQDIAGSSGWHKEIRDNSIKTLVAVDALVKHHPNQQLFGIVKTTARARIGDVSDEA